MHILCMIHMNIPAKAGYWNIVTTKTTPRNLNLGNHHSNEGQCLNQTVAQRIN